ncbi:MAG: HD domain-containing protein [Treponemataceae bacterium]|nr:HD domain-containing protein [Treponemataceae bacterium]
MGLESFVECGNKHLDQQLKFVAEIDKMTQIFRRTMLIDGSRRENDAEHSWHIAVMALLFSDYVKEKPDLGRVVKMLVVHDLVEIYAGDTFAFDVEANKSKEENEIAAADKLFSQLPEEQGKEIRSLWEEFDEMKTPDSIYANCMDRVQPFLHNTLTTGATWVEGGVAKSQVEKRLAVVKENMPELWNWLEINITEAIKKGWIKNE